MLSHKACVVAKPKMLWKHWSLVLLNGSDTSTDYFTFDPRLCTHSSESFCTVFGEICIVNTDFLQARDCPFVFHLKTVCVFSGDCYHQTSCLFPPRFIPSRDLRNVCISCQAEQLFKLGDCVSIGSKQLGGTHLPPLAASAFPRHLHALNPTRAPLRKMNLVTSVSRLLRSHCRIGIFVNCLQW